MTICHNPLNKKYAQAEWRMRTLVQMLTEAPDGLLKHEIEDVLQVENASWLIKDLKKRWGLEFDNEYLVQCQLLDGRVERYRLYRLTPECVEALSHSIAQVEAAGL